MNKIETEQDELKAQLHKEAEERYKRDTKHPLDRSKLVWFMHKLKDEIENAVKEGRVEEVGL